MAELYRQGFTCWRRRCPNADNERAMRRGVRVQHHRLRGRQISLYHFVVRCPPRHQRSDQNDRRTDIRCLRHDQMQRYRSAVYCMRDVFKAAFTLGQHVARQHVSRTSNLYPDTYCIC